MYTSMPLQMIDTLNNHNGFYAVLVSCAVAIIPFVLLSYLFSENLEGSGFVGFTIVCVVLCVISATVSFNSGTITKFENIPVTMKFVGFQAEGYNEEQRSGKYTKRVDVHRTYAVYEDANSYKIIIEANQNSVYPPIAVFYYNKQ
jgi:hypothetical protein